MIKKLLFILALFIIAVSSSCFMVYESSKFYSMHYMNAWQGIWLAAMLEAFVMLLAMIRVGGVFRQLGQKSLMFLLFCIIIFAAGLYAVKPTLDSVTSNTQHEDLKETLKNEVEMLDNELKVFDAQNQKGNTAKTAIRRNKAVQELKVLLRQKKSSNTGNTALIYIILLFVIRIAVQTSNIYCAWMIGYVYRSGSYVTTQKPKGKAPLCICGCGQQVEYSIKKGAWNRAINGHQFRKEAVEAAKKEKDQANTTAD